jgi:pimeloyl-ACP methyl ester carboxylesterase
LPFGRFILRPIVWFGSAKVGINPSKIRPIDAAKKWDRTKPAVILHAEADDLIGRSHADRFVEASGAKLIVLEGASHAQGQNSDHDLYLQSLRSLAKQVR